MTCTLSPYAKINEILAWCEMLIKYEKQIDLLCLEAKQAIQDKLNKLNPDTIESHANVDVKTY
jgi:3-keto-L-gulonate-6-phosphate decarboxylase